jgi:hypothetical protein
MHKKSRDRLHPMMVSARQTYNHSYKKKDKNCCDFETFYRLSQLPCHYCGRNPFRIYNIGNCREGSYYTTDEQKENGNFVYNGIDRIDSTKSHTSDNLVPCCWVCNRAKANKPVEEFLEWIELVYNYTKLTHRTSDTTV